MKKTNNKPDTRAAERVRLEADRTRRREQLATVETETAAVDAELQAIEAEREPLTLRSLDEPASEAALTALEERYLTAMARQRTLTAKADALRKALAEFDDAIRRLDYHTGQAAFRAAQADLMALAAECDALSATAAEALLRYQEAADALQRQGRALGLEHVRRLTDRDIAAGSLMRHLDPARAIAPQIHPRYRRPLAQQCADSVPGWLLEDRDPPPDWHPTPNADDAPSAATADTAREEIDDAH